MYFSLLHNTLKDNQRFGEICASQSATTQQGIGHTFCGKKAIIRYLLGVLWVKAFPILFYAILLIKVSFVSCNSIGR